MARKPSNVMTDTARKAANIISVVCEWDGQVRPVICNQEDMANTWVRKATTTYAGHTIHGTVERFALTPEQDFWFYPRKEHYEFIKGTMDRIKNGPSTRSKGRRKKAA